MTQLIARAIDQSTAYLLVSHGSRDPRPQRAMNHLAELVRLQLESRPQSCKVGPANLKPTPLRKRQSVKSVGGTSVLVKDAEPSAKSPIPIVETACLELAVISLSDRIHEFALRLVSAGITELKLVPIFLLSGVHVMEDIPAEVANAKARLGNKIKLTLCTHLGAHPGVVNILKQRLAASSAGLVHYPTAGSILVAHGSRRPKGNRSVQALAKQLRISVAYWATPPDIETQVIELMQQGHQKLTILPYFLFAGGITDAIMHRTEELAERFPKVQFRLLPTLGATEEVAQLTAALIDE